MYTEDENKIAEYADIPAEQDDSKVCEDIAPLTGLPGALLAAMGIENDDSASGLRYICTRPKGHDGPHAAHDPDDCVLAVWDDDRTTD